jgi:hypothetical protein
MKKMMMKIWMGAVITIVLQSQLAFAQKIDDERMKRDIEVAENVLSTLIKHEINSQRTFFGLEIKGSYQEGYGVTFRLPGDYAMPMIISTGDGGNFTYTYSDDISPKVAFKREAELDATAAREEAEHSDHDKGAMTLKGAAKEKRKIKSDSVRDEYNKKLIKAARDFIIDYGDFITQLGPNEKIIVTNQGENRSWYFKGNKRIHLSVEGTKADVIAFKQGKLNRDQALAKLKVINTESVEVKEPDLETLSSIFNRLYGADLSKTYFTQNNIYYERLKDYGVIYYMQVYSSTNVHEFGDTRRHRMPTLGLSDVDQETRDKKVTELYPKFEQDLKESILEYGRTLKTLKDEEVLVFNVTLTKCNECGIPATLEVTVKGSVLRDFGAGKLDKAAGLSKFTVKKGAKQ